MKPIVVWYQSLILLFCHPTFESVCPSYVVLPLYCMLPSCVWDMLWCCWYLLCWIKALSAIVNIHPLNVIVVLIPSLSLFHLLISFVVSFSSCHHLSTDSVSHFWWPFMLASCLWKLFKLCWPGMCTCFVGKVRSVSTSVVANPVHNCPVISRLPYHCYLHLEL